jgi:ankyrin repeat protein
LLTPSLRANTTTQWTAVHIAVLQGDVNMTRLLLEHGADPSQNTNHAWSVLHTAAAIRRAKTLEDLVAQRQEKLKRDLRDRKEGPRKLRKVAKGTVPERVPRPRLTRQEFEEAERKRKEEKAQQLAEDEKADVSAQTNEGVSEQMLKLLLENPASKALLNVNGKDERGRTALDIALLVGNLKGATVLAAHGGRTHKFGFPDGKGRNGTRVSCSRVVA